MKKNGFTITPESGSNNGKISVSISNTGYENKTSISVQGEVLLKL